jgi:hypothetical protein
MNHNKIIVHAQATKVEKEAAKAHDKAVEAVKKQSKAAHNRLQLRLQKRKTTKRVLNGAGPGTTGT